MKLFSCASCGSVVYFENVSCTRCGATLGFVLEDVTMGAFETAGDGSWKRLGDGRGYLMCSNYAGHAACNWMFGVDEDETFCAACRLNRTIPDLGAGENESLWKALEVEKRRLVYSLLRLRLPVVPRSRDDSGLEFDFLADAPATFTERGRVLTGHAQGLITINVAEADPAERERMRDAMDEPYRTVLGHFRHESGHYYWDRLVRDGPWLDGFRERFGAESADYAQALEDHHAGGPPADWRERFVSGYASSHPWEDWAETWAHYLHIVDTLETAHEFGLRIRPRAAAGDELDVEHDFDAYAEADVQALVAHWLPLSVALNCLNRSMGHEDAYPFVLAPAVVEKLGFVHRVVRGAGAAEVPNGKD